MWVYHRLHLYTDRNDGRGGRRSGNFSEDSATSGEGYTAHAPDTKEYNTLTPVTPAKTGSPGVTEVIVLDDSNSHVDGSFSGNLATCYLVCCLYVRKIAHTLILRETFSVKAVVRMLCDVGMAFIRHHHSSASKLRSILHK